MGSLGRVRKDMKRQENLKQSTSGQAGAEKGLREGASG